MRVRVKLQGTGTTSDPYHALLPDYVTVDTDVPGGTIIVDIPDRAHPFDAATMAAFPKTALPSGQVITALPAGQIARHRQFVDARYAEHKGEFNLEVQ